MQSRTYNCRAFGRKCRSLSMIWLSVCVLHQRFPKICFLTSAWTCSMTRLLCWQAEQHLFLRDIRTGNGNGNAWEILGIDCMVVGRSGNQKIHSRSSLVWGTSYLLLFAEYFLSAASCAWAASDHVLGCVSVSVCNQVLWARCLKIHLWIVARFIGDTF